MKFTTLTTTLLCVLLAACGPKTPGQRPQPETPKALEKEYTDVGSFSKGRGSNLVEGLYQELAAKTLELKKIDLKMQVFHESLGDSAGKFNEFDDRNLSYYNDADQYSGGIKDSLLRAKLKTVVAASMEGYKSHIAQHKALVELIDKRTIELQDLYTFLKVVRTLQVMEKYQKESLPSLKPMEHYRDSLDKGIGDLNRLIHP
jgi:hypothetical protein